MKTLTLDNALQIVEDPQAIERGYINPQTIEDAYKIAEAAIGMATFGKLGYLAPIGSPDTWWIENCPIYAEITRCDRYSRAKNYRMLLDLAEHLVKDDRRELVEARWTALEILRKSSGLNDAEDSEYVVLSKWLGYPAKL